MEAAAADWNLLAEKAVELSRNHDGLPIAMAPICRTLRVQVIRDEKLPSGRAHLRAGIGSGLPIIVLPERGKASWERFCIAHELGHLFLLLGMRPTPDRKSLYWKTEELCDAFARLLLMPRRFLSDTFFQRSLTYGQTLRNLDAFARTARAPWSQAAKRVTETEKSLVFFELERSAEGFSLVSKSSLNNSQGRFTKLPIDSQAWRLLEITQERVSLHDTNSPRLVDVAQMGRGKFPRLLMSLGIEAIEVAYGKDGKRLRVAGASSVQATPPPQPPRPSPTAA